jgi:glyoxylase-like metal-dependent hydrolase (beta-lactamase superfamily II)
VNVTRVPVSVSTRAPGGETNAYLVGESEALLVDPAAGTPALDEAVADRGVAHIAVTHTHEDHAGAVARYAAETGATVWARRGRTGRFERATGVDPDRTFAEGTAVPTGDGPVTVLETAGHAPDHVAFETPPATLCGDLAVAEGSVVVRAPEGDIRAYLTSLRRLHARDPPRLAPGHGPVVDDARATLSRLVAHRLRRERRVERAVADGARTVEDVLDAAYDKDLSGVRDLAGATVVAHLEKLAVEGRVARDLAERARGDGVL